MHNFAAKSHDNFLPLPNNRGSVPTDFPLLAIYWSTSVLNEAAVLKLLVFYGLSTEGNHNQRRVNLATHCGVRLGRS